MYRPRKICYQCSLGKVSYLVTLILHLVENNMDLRHLRKNKRWPLNFGDFYEEIFIKKILYNFYKAL